MRIGITMGLGARREATVGGLIDRALELEAAGFASVWLPNAFSFDAITALAAVGARTSTIEIGTAVVPTFPRHPVVMAQQAITAQQACEGRFTLGVGLSHKVMMEDALGIPFEHPARHMKEYLSVLAPLLERGTVSYKGSEYQVEASLSLSVEKPLALLVAALGPEMLRLAGTFADGTITSWVGPKTLAEHVVPLIARAASEAGRPVPRIAVGLPVVVTDDPDAVRAGMAPQVEFYNGLPSYRAMFDREGASGAAEVAIVGNEKEVIAQLGRIRDAGATDFLAQPIGAGPGSTARTMALLASLL